MYTIPSNVLPWFVASLALLVLSLRAWLHTRKVPSPITNHFVTTGLLAGSALAFYSIPSLISRDPAILRLGFIFGIPLLYAMLVYQSHYLWYGVLNKRIPFSLIFVPALAIGLFTAFHELSYAFTDNVHVAHNVLIFRFDAVSRYLQSVLLLMVVINGLSFVIQSRGVEKLSGKLRLISVGLLYILLALSSIVDNVFYHGENDAPLILYGYVVAAMIFTASLVIVMLRKPTGNN